jgi:hypothetical protein
MIRGTTPTHTFTVDIDPDAIKIKEVKVLYAQADELILCKRTEDCLINGNAIQTTLTQEDTFKFDCKKTVQIQIRALTTDGQLLSTDIMTTTVSKCLDNEVLK